MRLEKFCIWGGLAAMAWGVGLAEETPLPVTVVSAEALEEEEGTVLRDELDLFKPESLDDLSGLAPGFHIVGNDTAGYGSVVTMRGSGNALFFGPPAVAVTVDGVPQASAFAYPSELLDLESVQIHRGPRGAYGGRNAAAGLIELRTARPGDEHEGRFTLEYGSFDQYGASLSSRGPLAGDFSHAFQAYYRERDGFIRNTTLGGRRDDREVFGGLGKIFWNPREDIEGWLSFSTEHVDDGSARLTPLGGADPFVVGSDFPGTTQIERYTISGHLEREFDWGTLSATSGFSWWDLDPNTVDIDLSPVDLFRTRIEQSQDVFTQELRYDSPKDRHLRWQAGLFFMDVKNEGNTDRQLSPAPALFVESTDFQIDTTNVAFFANASYDLNESVTLDGGVRVDYYDSKLNRMSNTALPFGTLEDDNVYVSPTLGIDYQVNSCLNLFARTGLGIKPAGFTAFSTEPETASYEDERNWSNEVGLDYTPNDSLNIGLSAYWNQIDDYQVNQSVFGTTNFIITNAEEVTARGVELEVNWQAMPNLAIRGAFGYTDTEFDEYTYAGSDFAGNAVPFVPEFTGSLAGRYEFENGFYFQTAVRTTGRTNYDSAGSAAFSEGSYAIWNAEIGYQGENFSVALFGDNLLDEEYYTFINSQIGPGPPLALPAGGGSPGDPQVFGVRVSRKF